MKRSAGPAPDEGGGAGATPRREQRSASARRLTALRFVLIIGALSFFADFTYEGSRSTLGPYFASLGASALVVGIVTGFGELVGYGLRLVSGPWADRTGRYWPITILGYVVQMTAVPALALTHNWPEAAVLVVLERAGKAIRNPPRDTMLSHAGKAVGGFGWAFGLNEALDQLGAMTGPIVVALVLAMRGGYHEAFAVLAIPAVINLCLVLIARLIYPRPSDLEAEPSEVTSAGLPRIFWIYLIGAALAGAGFADYPLIAFHFAKAHIATGPWIAGFYSVAMAVSGMGSLVLGRLFDRFGPRVLIGLSLVSALFAPLVFFGHFWIALIGAAIWGLGMGGQESIIPAAVAPMAPSERRASAFGLFTGAYGIAWFGGSVVIGFLYGYSLMAVVVFCVAAELLAIPFFARAASRPPDSGR